jgi:hypothetical protein
MKKVHIFDHHHYHHTLEGQIGNGIPVFTGYRQRGRGLGSIFGLIGKYAIPFLSKYVFPHATSALVNTVSDVSKGNSFKSALRSNAIAMAKNVGKSIISPQSGSGLRGLKRTACTSFDSFDSGMRKRVKSNKPKKTSLKTVKKNNLKKNKRKTKKRSTKVKSKRDIFG